MDPAIKPLSNYPLYGEHDFSSPKKVISTEEKNLIAIELLNFQYGGSGWDSQDINYDENNTNYLFKKDFRDNALAKTSLEEKSALIFNALIGRRDDPTTKTPILNYLISGAVGSSLGRDQKNEEISENMRPFNLLMDLGADPNIDSDCPPLFEAIRSKSYFEVFKRLIDAGADHTCVVKVEKHPYNNESLGVKEFAGRTYFDPKLLAWTEKLKSIRADSEKFAKSRNLTLRPAPKIRDYDAEFQERIKYLDEHIARKQFS